MRPLQSTLLVIEIAVTIIIFQVCIPEMDDNIDGGINGTVHGLKAFRLGRVALHTTEYCLLTPCEISLFL